MNDVTDLLPFGFYLEESDPGYHRATLPRRLNRSLLLCYRSEQEGHP